MNIWRAFEKLLPKKTFRIATVQSVDSTNKQTTMLDPNGTTFIATGTSVSAPNTAFVIDGVVQEQATGLTDGGFIDI